MESEGVPADLNEEELSKRHKQEKKDLHAKVQALKKAVPKENELVDEDSNNQSNISEDLEIKEDEVDGKMANNRDSRAQKRRNKKAAEEREREKRISEQAEKNRGGPRETEMKSIKETLKSLNLHIYNIPADGNCLYCAVNHQLEVKGKKNVHNHWIKADYSRFYVDKPR
ncbi:unnamed protein product [Brassicogethes aeneus]|uniref:OTU domain-containing protein n=1 Tax=Brassicogethes aeneus TaxID=1431903 RepID=A0A9P0B8P2_BRAAE|nr:unnamed protein product [Brassicogethes aeneus]